MKTSPTLAPSSAMLLLLIGAQALTAAPDSPTLEIEPVALTLTRDAPPSKQRGFGSFGNNESSGGTTIVAKASMLGKFEGKLMPGTAKITSFEDDRGTDLESHEKEGKPLGMFGGRFNALSVSPQDSDGGFTVRVQSKRTPTKGASRITVKGSLSFCPEDATSDAKHGKLELTDDTTVEVGDARLRFTKGTSGFGFSKSKEVWYVQILPGPTMIAPEILLFGDDDDLPVLNTADRSRVMQSSVHAEPKSPFKGLTGRGFECPSDKLSRIKVRFFKKGSLIEVPFEFKLGLGDFGSPGALN